MKVQTRVKPGKEDYIRCQERYANAKFGTFKFRISPVRTCFHKSIRIQVMYGAGIAIGPIDKIEKEGSRVEAMNSIFVNPDRELVG
ncbi:hypothetical protein VNO78_03964 [Psophocarpus tetragonolobus]|uniref:Uncharacterized protein n=1 Tax=Psophocarpus tetragonolobus TaxID=3891 RepID=A0AAN9XW11_PSOTE